MFQRILVANRGEIALRVIRACRDMGIEAIAVYSRADRDAEYLKLAHDAICIGSDSNTIIDPLAELREIEHCARRLAERRNVLVPAGSVLRARRADVDGHTLLYVALARAAGIPARPVSGLLLVDGRFYFHSWAEIFLDRWVPVDPTWNQFPADAGRLRLLVDGYARPLDLLPMTLGLEVHLPGIDLPNEVPERRSLVI